MFDRIDKNNPTPLYYQLQEILREKIECGVWKPGETIPTEMEIVDHYGISRSTVRQAILGLVNDGYVRREKSKGTIVISAADRKRVIGSLMSFTAEMDMKGIQHYSRILNQSVEPADAILAAKLELQTDADVYYLKRIRYINDRPFLLDEHFIPYYLVPEIVDRYRENTSLYALLQETYHLNLSHGQITFETVLPPSAEASGYLKVNPSTSLILAERIVYSESDVALDYFKAYIHGKVSIDVLNSQNI